MNFLLIFWEFIYFKRIENLIILFILIEVVIKVRRMDINSMYMNILYILW